MQAFLIRASHVLIELSSATMFPSPVRTLKYDRPLYRPLPEDMTTDTPILSSRSTFNMEEDLESNENGLSAASQITGV